MESIVRVNAFVGKNLLGNPAAVCVTPRPMEANECQATAKKLQLPVTAFVSPQQEKFSIRWFTPISELPLCGHGTLAASYVLFAQNKNIFSFLEFDSHQAGKIYVQQQNDVIVLNLPKKKLSPSQCTDVLTQGLNASTILEVVDAEDRLLVVLESSQHVKDMQPDIEILKKIQHSGIVITAADTTVDFVSRTFYPHKPNWEDAVTGASHCALIPYWASKFKKTELHAHQVSPRGGEIFCGLKHDRVLLGGRAELAL